MWPVLFTVGGFEVRSYAVAVVAAFVVGSWLRRREVVRLRLDEVPSHAWIGTGALLGGILGSKLGMVWFGPMSMQVAWASLLDLDLTGKTVYGGLLGGWLGVEVTKWWVGLARSTGDAFVAPLLVGQAIGRIGCWANGCCVGIHGFPVQLLEATLDLVLLAVTRRAEGRAGRAFRWTIVGYSLIRVLLDPLRADERWMWGPLSALQWSALAVAIVVTARQLRPITEPAASAGPGGAP